jgi:hypothetical protein
MKRDEGGENFGRMCLTHRVRSQRAAGRNQRKKMSLKDRLAKADEGQQAAEKTVNERWERYTDAFNPLIGLIRTMVNDAGVKLQEQIGSVRDSNVILNFAAPEIVLKRGGLSVQIQVQPLTARGGNITIQGGAKTPETQLLWNGAGNQLSDWSVKDTPSGPSNPLTEEKLEDAIAKHLGV